MACDIDPDLPKVGIPRLNKAAYERNFGAAKGCIEDLQARVEALELGGGGAGVVTFEGRTGVVVSQSGDYDAAEISSLGPLATETVAGAQALLADNLGRDLFQQYRDAPGQFTTDFTFSEATSGRALIQINSGSNTVKMTLPDASTLTGQDGWLCDVRVASGAFASSVEVAVPGQMGVQTGYSITNFDPEANEQFFGLNQATALNNVYSLYKRGSVYQWQAGFFRNAALDDLTFDGPLHGGGGGGAGLTIDDLPAQTGLAGATSLLEVWSVAQQASEKATLNDVLAIGAATPVSGLYGSAVIPATADLAGLNAAIAATTAGNPVVFCPSSAGTYDLSGGNNNVINRPFPILIVGDGSTVFDGGIGAPGAGIRKFDVRSSVTWQGINWQGFNEIWTFGNLAQFISFEVSDCSFDTMNGALQRGIAQGVTPGEGFDLIRFNNNVVTSSTEDVVRMELGSTGALTNFVPVRRCEMIGNVIKNYKRIALGVFYNSNPTGAIYPLPGGSVSVVKNNDVGDGITEEDNVNAVRADACQSSFIQDNYLHNIVRSPASEAAGDDSEGIYTKAPHNVITGNILINAGQRQGCISLKGEPGNPPQNYDLPPSVCANNVIEVNGADFEAGLHIQRSNVEVSNNWIRGDFTIRAINNTEGFLSRNVLLKDNTVEVTATGNTVGAGLRVRGNLVDWELNGNTWISNTATAHTVIEVRDNGASILNPVIKNETFRDVGGANVTAILVQKDGGTVDNVTIASCHFQDINTAVNFNGTPTGDNRVRLCSHSGSTPTINTPPGGLDTFGNTF